LGGEAGRRAAEQESVSIFSSDLDDEWTPQQLVDFVFGIAAEYFPRLVPDQTNGPQNY